MRHNNPNLGIANETRKKKNEQEVAVLSKVGRRVGSLRKDYRAATLVYISKYITA